MREFTLTNPERADCYSAVNMAPQGQQGKGGFVIDDKLELAKGVLLKLRNGSALEKIPQGEVRSFASCDESETLSFKEKEFEHLVSCLKGHTYMTVEKAMQVQDLIAKLDDVPSKGD